MAKFPQLIHVVEEGEGDERYFIGRPDGIAQLDEPNQEVAIYQFVKVGRVSIQKQFIEGKKR